MRICILGGDGYLGWPTAMYFSARGHEVLTLDNMSKRLWEAEVDAAPLFAVPYLSDRARYWQRCGNRPIHAIIGDVATDYDLLRDILRDFCPDAIVHYAEQPSAPYSMMSRVAAVRTQQNNVIGTLNVMFAMRESIPDSHLIKLGTMGEYGTPNIDIEEGWLEVEHKGRRDRMLYPKKAHSLYHLSKVHDSHNLEFACRVWGLRVTDLNQGVVYGMDTSEMAGIAELMTSFHYDDIFGTVINRFVVQAVAGMPLTVYGAGGQTRGYLNIRDTLRCVELAALSPPETGEFRVFNQFTEQFSIAEIAATVQRAASSIGLHTEIQHVPNPRAEQEQHYYHAIHSGLVSLGLEPHRFTEDIVIDMIRKVQTVKGSIRETGMLPRVTWHGGGAGKYGGT